MSDADDLRRVREWNRLSPEEAAELDRVQEDTRASNESAIRGLRRDGVLEPERAERLVDDYARPAGQESGET